MAELREQAEGMDPADQEGPTVRVAGRILLLRNAGRLVFLTLADRSGWIAALRSQ